MLKKKRGGQPLSFGQASLNMLYKDYKRNAERANRVFELTDEQFKELTQRNCYYCRRKPAQVVGRPYYNGYYVYNGIDRVDNTKGYTIDNVVPCCKRCNQWKRAMTATEFIEHAQRIADCSK